MRSYKEQINNTNYPRLIFRLMDAKDDICKLCNHYTVCDKKECNFEYDDEMCELIDDMKELKKRDDFMHEMLIEAIKKENY